MGKINCASIAFAPLGEADVLSPVEAVLEMIASSGLKYEVGVMSTLVWGAPGELAELLEQIQSGMDGVKFILDIRISNVCGCSEGTKACGFEKN